MFDDEKHISWDMLLNFEGRLKYSPIFYGYYLNREVKRGYNIPTAYFMIGIGVYIYSFIATLRKYVLSAPDVLTVALCGTFQNGDESPLSTIDIISIEN